MLDNAYDDAQCAIKFCVCFYVMMILYICTLKYLPTAGI